MTMGPAMDDRDRLLRLESMLSGLLRYGALIASAWIAAGMALGLHADLGHRCAAIGIVLLIALPALRIALTTAIFLIERDYLFAAFSSTVLAIITVGFIAGVALSRPARGPDMDRLGSSAPGGAGDRPKSVRGTSP